MQCDKDAYILCDSSAAIDLDLCRNDNRKRSDLFKRITELEMLLSAVNISVYLSWIPGHCDVQAIEEVDMLARTLANDIHKNRVFAPSAISLAAAVQMLAEIAKESWQCRWNHGSSGYYAGMLIPTVGVKLFFPSSRDFGISYCRMLLHDTMLMEDSFRTGTSDSPLCECGVECESVEHFLVRCPMHETARKEMITDINTAWSLWSSSSTMLG